MKKDNGWEKYGFYILEELKTHKESLHELHKSVEELKDGIMPKINKLEVKSSVWGALAGGIAGAVSVVANFFNPWN